MDEGDEEEEDLVQDHAILKSSPVSSQQIAGFGIWDLPYWIGSHSHPATSEGRQSTSHCGIVGAVITVEREDGYWIQALKLRDQVCAKGQAVSDFSRGKKHRRTLRSASARSS